MDTQFRKRLDNMFVWNKLSSFLNFFKLSFLGLFPSLKDPIHQIRKNWAQPRSRLRNFERIALFHHLKSKGSILALDSIDDQTWSDLNLEELFSLIDHCDTPIGSQLLYHRLRTINQIDPQKLQQDFSRYSGIQASVDSRESIQKILMPIMGEAGFSVSHLLFSPLPNRPKFFPLFYLLSALSIASMICLAFYAQALFVLIPAWLINIAISGRFSRSINEYSQAFGYLHRLTSIGLNLASTKINLKSPQITRLAEIAPKISALRSKINFFKSDKFDKWKANEIAFLFAEYFNLFCLVETIHFFRSVRYVEINIQILHELFDSVASLDCDIAIASYISGSKYCCLPTLADKKDIDVVGIYHPLIANAVPNDFAIKNKSAIFIGSNMSGKTTFMRTFGINMILFRSFGICHALAACLPDLQVKTSINRADDLINSASYFRREADHIMSFFVATSGAMLYIIDEIFKGTNHIERVGAATAVLENLAQANLVFVTTHDVEIVHRLERGYLPFSFKETVADAGTSYDYLIHEGVLVNHNALRILRNMNYPSEILTSAERIVSEQRERLKRSDPAPIKFHRWSKS